MFFFPWGVSTVYIPRNKILVWKTMYILCLLSLLQNNSSWCMCEWLLMPPVVSENTSFIMCWYFSHFIPFISTREQLIEHIKPLMSRGILHFNHDNIFNVHSKWGKFYSDLYFMNREIKTWKDYVGHWGLHSQEWENWCLNHGDWPQARHTQSWGCIALW